MPVCKCAYVCVCKLAMCMCVCVCVCVCVCWQMLTSSSLGAGSKCNIVMPACKCAFVRALKALQANVSPFPWLMQGVFCCRRSFYIYMRIYTAYMTVFMVIFLPKISYTHRIYMYGIYTVYMMYTPYICIWFWPTLHNINACMASIPLPCTSLGENRTQTHI